MAVTLAFAAGTLVGAAGSAHASTIVFVCGKDLCRTDAAAIEKPGQIVLFDARTAQLVANLTAGPRDSGPVFSPDGNRVAFTRGSSIWTVPAAGGAAKRLIRRGTQPAWSR